MTFDEFTALLADEFPKAVQAAIAGETRNGRYAEPLFELCNKHYREWGFDYPLSAWEEAVPKSDRLTLFAWSEAGMVVDSFRMRVSIRAFCIAPDGVHIEISSERRKPLPFTSTGYRSYFVPLVSFQGGATPADFVRAQFPRDIQLELF